MGASYKIPLNSTKGILQAPLEHAPVAGYPKDVKKGYQVVNNESDMHEADQAQKENINPHCTIGADASTQEKVQVRG